MNASRANAKAFMRNCVVKRGKKHCGKCIGEGVLLMSCLDASLILSTLYFTSFFLIHIKKKVSFAAGILHIRHHVLLRVSRSLSSVGFWMTPSLEHETATARSNELLRCLCFRKMEKKRKSAWYFSVCEGIISLFLQ